MGKRGLLEDVVIYGIYECQDSTVANNAARATMTH